MATFLARQHLISDGICLACLPDVELMLDEWFAARLLDPQFIPAEPKPEVASAFAALDEVDDGDENNV